MANIIVLQMPAFKRAYKKLHDSEQALVDQAVSLIVSNPSVGEEKKGDLAGVYVVKVPVNRQQMLLAYEWDPATRILLLLGSHENFYRTLKRG